jgi:hypothetical protein
MGEGQWGNRKDFIFLAFAFTFAFALAHSL